MIEQLQTIRAGLETATCYTMLGVDAHSVQTALTALTQLEAMVGEQEPVAKLHDDGYWTPMKTEAGRALNERLLRAGSPSIEVYTAAPVAQQPSKATLEKLRAWETNGELIDRAWQVLQSQEQEIMRLEKMLAEDRAQQPQAEVVPPGYVADKSFRWDGEKQQHIPRLIIEFKPVPANSPCDAQGWKDRDQVAQMFDAAIAQQKGGV